VGSTPLLDGIIGLLRNRELLRFPLPPLELGDSTQAGSLEHIESSPACRLFVERA
jgi:hypothetical protein